MDTATNDKVMIALLPITTNWSTLDLPHLTLVYSGKIEDHKDSDLNAMAKDCSALAAITRPLTLNVTRIGVLGPPEDLVSVLMIRPSVELMALRNFVEEWNLSEFTEFKPHCTIGPYPGKTVVEYTPSMLAFDRLLLAWGDQQFVFSLK